ncbi:hypothetical protein U4I41_12790 [Stenotrophomonas maltophilia]|uniref:hypothetical protein n=1 Tax=Stenotrophomonas maltophilia TaxID=40324 RepID=UPI0018D28B53|nr:hypothetical protein [Stenotrophomonas maltophilia]MBH1655828.1 hypothetical protein [Stenotrophomonas maltophilia]MBH1844208.1 hypothetical protein [Stenotrophomonas maltophilia]MDZ5833234.1 hypothetical protein [Stenotrophomonas maltophilia]
MSILLRYQGPAVDDGTMNVYDAAANMVAFSDFVVAAAHKVYGEDVYVKAEITAYKHASFGTDLLFQVVGASMAVLPLLPDLVSVATTVKDSIELFRFLKGEEPAKVVHNDDHSINVTNNSGNIIVVNTPALSLTLDPKAGLAASQFIGEALSKPGVNQIEISRDGKQIAQATREDATYFHPIISDDTATETVTRLGLVVESLSFKDGNKWRMWNGGESLLYGMEDEDFRVRVNNGEAFRKGDILICEVLVKQTKINGTLKLQRTILKVHDHQMGPEQPPLLEK